MPIESDIIDFLSLDGEEIYFSSSWGSEGRLRDDQITDDLLFPLNPNERNSYLFDPSEVKYQGPWYDQSSSHSCVPWAIANAGMVLGYAPNLDSIWNLSVLSNNEQYRGNGISFREATRYVNEDPRMSYRLLSLEANSDGKSHTPFDVTSQTNSERISTGIFLTKLLDNIAVKKPILIGVVSKLFSGEEIGSHALCISGYRVSKQGRIDLQVIDSARGIYWVPEERVRKSRNFLSDVLICEYKETEGNAD